MTVNNGLDCNLYLHTLSTGTTLANICQSIQIVWIQHQQVQPQRKQRTNNVLAPSGTGRSACRFTSGQTWQIPTVRCGCAAHVKIYYLSLCSYKHTQVCRAYFNLVHCWFTVNRIHGAIKTRFNIF